MLIGALYNNFIMFQTVSALRLHSVVVGQTGDLLPSSGSALNFQHGLKNVAKTLE